MSDKRTGGTDDAYNELLKNFSSFKKHETETPADDSDVKNNGEIYFSANSKNGVQFEKPVYPEIPKNREHILIPEEKKAPEAVVSHKKPVQNVPMNKPAANPGRTSAASQTVSSHQNISSSARQGTVKTTSITGKTGYKPATSQPTAQSANQKSNQKYAQKAAKSAAKKSYPKSLKVSGKNGFIIAMVLVVLITAASFAIRIPIMGCINDIIAIDRDDTMIRITVTDGMTTGEVIDMLGKKDLIYSTSFCKLFTGFEKYDMGEICPAGSYDLSASMGVEGMLAEIYSAGATEKTVTLTFPEGYTVSQIVQRLSSNGVATASKLNAAFSDAESYKDYPFLANITDTALRYKVLEGYLYPDTYEFYIGENPISVVKRFLDNFNSKWTEEYEKRAQELGMSVDEILTVASILEKEAKDAEQMSLIASIVYNRLKSSSFPLINCDSTAKYIEAYKDELQKAGTYDAIMKVYDTYQQTGLPIGPICNPGADAIKAALYPDSTDYYYFLHSDDGKIYVARIQQEHENNLALINQ